MEIADRRVATLHFTLIDADGRQVGSTQGHDPLVHVQGTGGIVQALEKALEGKSPGDRFSVQVQPEEGFGPRHPGLVQTLPRSFYDGQQPLQPGDRLKAQTAQGPMEVVVTAVDGETLTVDGNHPLAGKPFRLDVEIIDVRLATPEEIQLGAVTRAG